MYCERRPHAPPRLSTAGYDTQIQHDTDLPPTLGSLSATMLLDAHATCLPPLLDPPSSGQPFSQGTQCLQAEHTTAEIEAKRQIHTACTATHQSPEHSRWQGTNCRLSTNSEGDVSSACASAYGSARSVHCDSCCSLWSSKGPELLHVFMLTLCGCQLCFTPTLASLCCCSLCLSLQALCFVCLCSCVRLRLQKLLCSSHRSHVFRFPSFNFHLCTVTPLARRTDGERDRTAREKARESDRTDSKDKSLEATRVTDAT